MASRVKEDEKNEKIIRGLLKLPANRRCMNCNSLGPQYVCINFWTFICTTCSGIHREFTHRVKSVSMAKFTSQEVSALQGGGNERAREIYFKEWDAQRHSQPDSSNVERLRDFIKHVYVDRRYTGERATDKPPRVKMGDREDSNENRRYDTYRGGSRSPPYEDAYERRYGSGGRNDDRNFRYGKDERRSPGYDQQSQRHGEYRRSPARFEVVDDRFRDDRFPNGRRFEDRKLSDGESKLDGKSPNHQKDSPNHQKDTPNHQKDLDASSPPMVRPVREILGEDVPPLRVGEPPKENGKKVVDGSAHTQRTASSSSLGTLDGTLVELKKASTGSLIDFNDDPEPPVASVAPQPQPQPTPPPTMQSVPQPATSSYPDSNDWASFAFGTQEKVSQVPSNVNTLESVLSQLAAPPALPISNTSALPGSTGAPSTVPVGNVSMFPPSAGLAAASLGISTSHGYGAPAVAPSGNMSMFPVSGNAPTAAHGGMMSGGGNTFVKATDGGPWPNGQQHQYSLFSTSDSQSAAHQAIPSVSGAPSNQLPANGAPNNQLTPSVSGNPSSQLTPSGSGASNNQQWGSSVPPNVLGTLNTLTAQPSQLKPVQDASSGASLHPALVEGKMSGRKELPQDLFTSAYSSVPTVPGWQTGPRPGMGFGMQYPTAMPISAFPNSAKSSNPFDLNTEPSLAQASMFPSMALLQGALPNMVRPTGLLRTSSIGTSPAQWMQPQSPSYASAFHPQSPSYASAPRPQSPSYASAMPPSAYMGQQSSSNMLSFGHRGAGGFGNDGAAFGNLGMDQHLAGRYSQPATPNSFSSVGGNPFG
ncbi:methyl-CpG-binding domain protein 6 [Macadamia integrifolia]|uniref:methyl-CpG-binding domain protein 6 n=1 Tax=Macadamia integrifolia TaxID=60698 RepID=UPI001C4F19F5|nr:methyl-CpG-binding domain protein 6 [Macadamia integrifolia]XP_042490603.1 methyl-CpG-binding domain protein 6 [Macadamia integrifolia]XP_042490604.1 methyl-CpG-binding domain protein 6 [Macadamia integrifolia]XP_042490605.1 methyl-CpG-binding domain protein 6 [Macadamia integrifolia]